LDGHVEAAQDRNHSTAEIRLYADDVQRGVHSEQTTPDIGKVPNVPDSSAIPPHGVVTDPAIHLFGERPTKIIVKAIDYSRKNPNETFRGSTTWLTDHIIKVASGSRKPDSFPRIAPLISLDIPIEYAVSVRELKAVVNDIRSFVSRLRPPHEDNSGGDIRNLLTGFDPNNPTSMLDALRSLTDKLREKDKGNPNRPTYADSAREDGGWVEGDGDGWNKP
jgi:hypothetical protein